MMIGRKLLHYEIIEKLGEGGMGEVYRGRDAKLGLLSSGDSSDHDTTIPRTAGRQADTQ